MISSISSCEPINVGCCAKSKGRMPDLKTFFWTAAYVGDATTVYSNGIKRLLVNGLNTFFIKA